MQSLSGLVSQADELQFGGFLTTVVIFTQCMRIRRKDILLFYFYQVELVIIMHVLHYVV